MSGLIHIYCGDGKGKTTAAVGLAIRSCAGGYQVIFTQFMKSRDTGELKLLNSLEGVTVLRGAYPSKFSWDYTEEERQMVYQENNRLFHEAVNKIIPTGQTLLILDELVGSLDKGLLDKSLVLDFLQKKPEQVEVVMTGRNPCEELMELADYVSEIRKLKHPYEKGINARKGIEF